MLLVSNEKRHLQSNCQDPSMFDQKCDRSPRQKSNSETANKLNPSYWGWFCSRCKQDI